MVVASASAALHAQGCIFCLRHDGGFTAREHVFPESLGNTSIVLSPGVVCDRCNNGPLADAEQALVQFPIVAFMRVLLGHTNKKGERPVAKWNNATLSSPTQDHIVINAENERAFRIVNQVGNFVHGRLNFTSGGPISAARYRKIACALWKATLECMYLDHGEMIFERRFNDIREMVQGTRPAAGFLLFPKNVQEPSTEVSLTYQFVPSDVGVLLPSSVNFGGIPIFTELLTREFRGDREAVGQTLNVVEF